MYDTDDLHVMLGDPSTHSDLPSTICCHKAIRHALLMGSVILTMVIPET